MKLKQKSTPETKKMVKNILRQMAAADPSILPMTSTTRIVNNKIMQSSVRRSPRVVFYIPDTSVPTGESGTLPVVQLRPGMVAVHPVNVQEFRDRLLQTGYLTFRLKEDAL